MDRKFLIVGIGLVGLYLFRDKGKEIMRDLENEVYIMTGNQTCGERNNNPGNIRPSGSNWQGMIGTATCGVSGTFIKFSSPEYGIRAIAKDLLTKYGRGLDTIRKIITVYAPPSENNTEAYISQVSKAVGVGSNVTINLRDPNTMSAFVYAIIHHENGRVIYSAGQIAQGIAMAY